MDYFGCFSLIEKVNTKKVMLVSFRLFRHLNLCPNESNTALFYARLGIVHYGNKNETVI